MEGGMVGVLLVEDDTATADLYAYKLRLDGFAVTVVGDCQSAESTFWRERPDVVCLDERLPGGTGTDIAERFAAAGANVVLLTNDESRYRKPPRCVCRSLLKASTNPIQLSAAISELVDSTAARA
jgi:DNA-binding NtrC family response regulator